MSEENGVNPQVFESIVSSINEKLGTILGSIKSMGERLEAVKDSKLDKSEFYNFRKEMKDNYKNLSDRITVTESDIRLMKAMEKNKPISWADKIIYALVGMILWLFMSKLADIVFKAIPLT